MMINGEKTNKTRTRRKRFASLMWERIAQYDRMNSQQYEKILLTVLIRSIFVQVAAS